LARKWFKACDFEDADDEMLAEMVESALLASWDAACEACAKMAEAAPTERPVYVDVTTTPGQHIARLCRALKGQGGE
jgi:hypothetical protein